MNLNVSIAEWVSLKAPLFPSLTGLSVVTMGETGDLAPPFLGIMESGSAPFEQGGQTLYGVSTYELTCELHTVPQEEDQDGTPAETERLMRADLYDILGNRSAIDYLNGRNFWTVFDIRAAGPITEAQDGRRISRWIITVVASPL